MPFFFSVFSLLMLLLMDVSQPKSYNYKEVLVNCQVFTIINGIQYRDTVNICDINHFNLSQELDDGDDYMNTADLNVYGNLWKKENFPKREDLYPQQIINLIMLAMIMSVYTFVVLPLRKMI